MAKLLPIRDPYAAVWVAVYEPLIIDWVGWQALSDMTERFVARQAVRRDATPSWAPTLARFRWSAPRQEMTRGETPAALLGPRTVAPVVDGAEAKRRFAVLHQLLTDHRVSIGQLVETLGEQDIPHLCGTTMAQVLSPVGLAHLYRQLYFDDGAGIGPIEQVIGIAPNEVLEITQEVSKRRTVETIEEVGMSQSHESEISEQVIDEISEQVQMSITTDASVAVSAHGEGSIGVFSGGGSASVDLSRSSERASEAARRHSLSRTRRAAQVVQRTHTLTVRSSTDIVNRSSMRRMIKNETSTPVNYALRRVLRRVKVKVQSIGPRLVWQIYVCRPGIRLAKSRLVMFREADPAATPELPPNAPPRPSSGAEHGTQTVQIRDRSIMLNVPTSPQRAIRSVTIESLFDPSPEGKEPRAPVLTGDAPELMPSPDPATLSYLVRVVPGSARAATVNYMVEHDPSPAVLAEWEAQVAAARAEWESRQREEQFERAKRVIEAKLRVRPRPAADLRQEERYEVLNRLISEAFHHSAGRGLPAPLEIEIFHRLFDVSALYYFVHPSWWEPRYVSQRGEYEITDESEPAPLGASLGWVLQMDGDRRRNEFLNSPWVRACIPMRPGLEREAVDWLAQHVEGRRGFSLDPAHPVGHLIAEIEGRRERERNAPPGPEYLTLDGEVPPERIAASEVFPVIDEFEILQPTEGFVYQRLDVEE